MKNFLYTLLFSFLVLSFSGCSDSYETALESDDLEKLSDGITEIENIAKEKIELSEETEFKITTLQDTIDQMKSDAETTDGSSTAVVTAEVINDTFEVIEDMKSEISIDETLSTTEKSEAINRIEDIERENFDDGLNTYTFLLQNTDVEENVTIPDECKEADNTGALPPSPTFDDCIK